LKKLILLIFGLLLFAQEKIYICDDSAQWPPFIFKQKDEKLAGISVDIAKEVFKRINTPYKIELIPWKRCLYLVANYDKVKKYQMFMDGAYSKKRAEYFYISDPVYYTHPSACYNKDKTTGTKLYKTLKQTPEKLRYCDVNGYQTETYYRFLGLGKDVKIDQGAKSTCDVLKKISRGRCDVMIGGYEGTIGYALSGKCKIPENISFLLLPEKYATAYYMFVSKKYPKAKELINKINSALKEMKKDGTYQKILDKWLKNFGK